MAILVERDHIGIFGRMNAGKSSLMNLITQQETSLVDAAPGTTADTKTALLEIHGLGPVKLFDTAGADEGSALGEKKRRKVFADLKACDLVVLVIDPSREEFGTESELLDAAREHDKAVVVVYNLFRPADAARIPAVESALPRLRFHRKLALALTDPAGRDRLIGFLRENLDSRNAPADLLPFVKPGDYVVLVIPMDVETPPGRLLRPQAMAEEHIVRRWAYPVSFRLDLAKARSADPAARDAERARFLSVVEGFRARPSVVITDSQAVDVMVPGCPPDIALTTFSIVMIHYMSRGRLGRFAAGLAAFEAMRPGDKILIAEACNHSRIGEDIGTVQIPRLLAAKFPGVAVEHNFGREFQDNKDLAKYKLVIHCGGCMITPQTLSARVRDLEAVGVPYSNYGLVLAYLRGPAALARVLAPWNLSAGWLEEPVTVTADQIRLCDGKVVSLVFSDDCFMDVKILEIIHLTGR